MSSSKTLQQIASCEATLVGALTSDRSDLWSPLTIQLHDARRGCVGEDAVLVSLVDELQAIASVFAGDRVPRYEAPLGDNDPRIGYGVVAAPSGEAIYPSFASLLQRFAARPSEIAVHLPLLAIGDSSLWRHLRSLASPSGESQLKLIALRWLRSPCRRLAWDLTLLEPHGQATGEFVAELVETAGPPDDESFTGEETEWPYIHACTPLERVELPPTDDAAVVRALRALAAPQWVWSRSQAISTLLQRAATVPKYRVGGLTSDLREELPARIGAAFAVPDDEPILELEWELLRLSSLLVAEHGAEVAFRVARWVGYVIAKSPFHANDARVLAAKLAAIRRGVASPPPDSRDDVLHPRRLLAALQDDYERWREFVTAIGAAGHYLSEGDTYLSPVPVTLVDQLRRIAARSLTSSEAANEAAAGRRVDKLDNLQRHLAPPWIARAVLHRTRTSWLAQLDRAALRGALASLDAQPARYGWLAESVALAAGFLQEEVRRDLAAWWATKEATEDFRAHQLLLVATAVVGEIAKLKLIERVMMQLAEADRQWRGFLANALVMESRRIGDRKLEDQFLQFLADLVDDKNLTKTDRERALAWLLQRLQADGELTTKLETRLRRLGKDPLVTGNPRLRVLMAELGFEASRGAK